MTKKPSDLLYGRRKRGPGPKPVDMSELYDERLGKALTKGLASIDDRRYNIEFDGICASEIIIVVENWFDHCAAVITAEPFINNGRPTYPIEVKIESCEYEDDRWKICRGEPGKAEIHNRLFFSIDTDDQAAGQLAELVITEILIPVMEELKVG